MDDRIDHLGDSDNNEHEPEPEEGSHADETRESHGENAYAEFHPEAAAAEPEVWSVPDKDEKLWAMICHLSALVAYLGIPFGHILGPLIIWLIKKDESKFLDVNGKKALNFQISLSIYGLASTPLLCLGPLILIVVIPLMIVGVIFPILAAVTANKGEEVNYPISIEFIK